MCTSPRSVSAAVSRPVLCRSPVSVTWSEVRSRTFCRFFICFQTYSHLLNPEMQSPETQSRVDAEMCRGWLTEDPACIPNMSPFCQRETELLLK